MSNHANYAKIGFTVILGIVATVAVLIYLGGAVGDDDIFYVETYYDTSVSGLSVGSAVNFRGVKVGEVKEISFVGAKYEGVPWADAQRIYIRMALFSKSLGPDARNKTEESVKRGMRATVTASGVTGLSRVELDTQRGRPQPAPLHWKPENMYVPSYPSLLDSFSDSATKVMNEINRMDIASAWSNISATVESAAQATEGIRTIIDSAREGVGRIVDEAAEAATSLRAMAEELRRNPSLAIRERKAAPLDETE